MTASRGIRRAWTGRERVLVKQFADEGLSISRTVTALANLYSIKVTVRQLRGFVQYHKIRFKSNEAGAPIGNQNWKGRCK